MNTEKLMTIRHITPELEHQKFMQMAKQVMAEFKKIDATLETCLGASSEHRQAA